MPTAQRSPESLAVASAIFLFSASRETKLSQPGSLQGSPQKGIFLVAETRNV